MFLIPASSCLARLHHSLLINSFLLPSSPTGRLLAPHRGCRTRTLPHAAPRPGGSHSLSRPQLLDHSPHPHPGSEPPTSASPRGRALDSHLGEGDRLGSGPKPWGLELQREPPSGTEVGVWWGRPLPLGAPKG